MESTLFGTVRLGTLPDSFQRFAVIYGGLASGATAGILAVGPSQDYPGSALRPAASAQFPAGFPSMADRGVRAAALFEQRVYLGGSFLRAGEVPVYHIAGFDGERVHQLGTGVDGVVNTLSHFGARLIVGGGFSKAYQPLVESTDGSGQIGGVLESGGLVAWEGGRWALVGGEVLQGFVSCSFVAGETLYIGGRFSAPGRENNLAFFAGGKWASMCDAAGVCGVTGGEVHALTAFGEDLYIGGSFTSAGSVPVQVPFPASNVVFRFHSAY